ncbi:MAG: BON domain-containing protein [Phormidesmis sp. RL_2_1]|nr:BON domain-containing protein [Phormidesmis sp. RL_2_1]
MGVLGESLEASILTKNQLLPTGNSAVPFNIFPNSPPERIGIQGEYDYYGLAHRVAHHFQQVVGDGAARLKVRQRGCVVILTGTVASRDVLNRLVTLAGRVEGAGLIETHRVTFSEDEIAA